MHLSAFDVASRSAGPPRDALQPGPSLRGISIAFLKLKYDILGRLDRYAIVGGPAWLRVWVTALDKLTKADIRYFKASDEPLAWKWLGAEPKRLHPLVS